MVDGISRVGNMLLIAAGNQDQGPVEESGGVAPGVRDRLLALNPSLRGPLEKLLNWKFVACAAAPQDQPKNCYETTAFVTGLDFKSRRREQTGDREPILDDQDKIAEMLAAGGYRKTAEFYPYRQKPGPGLKEKVIAGINSAAIPKNLKSGDLIMFGWHSVDAKGKRLDRYVHAMVYLGRAQGQEYVFEKQNLVCGPADPYRIISLKTTLARQVGLGVTEKNIDRVFVYRKRPPP
jgi:hypothetical protein